MTRVTRSLDRSSHKSTTKTIQTSGCRDLVGDEQFAAIEVGETVFKSEALRFIFTDAVYVSADSGFDDTVFAATKGVIHRLLAL